MMNYVHLPTLDEAIREIEDSVHQTEHGLCFSQHPLHQSLWTHQEQNLPEDTHMGRKWLRRHVGLKLDDLRRYAENLDWERWVWVFERPYRVSALCARANEIHEDLLAKLILDIWVDTEFPHQSRHDWTFLFNLVTPDQLNATLPEADREERDLLPDRIKLHRGFSKNHVLSGVTGWSWTLNKDRAWWFARRFDSVRPVVMTEIVPKHLTVGPINYRGESEMLYFPEEDNE